jgi:hypothetical protein
MKRPEYPKIEYAQEGAIRQAERINDTIQEVLESRGRDGWEAWHMEDLLDADGTNHVRIYFRRSRL